MSHQLTFAARAWRDSAGATAGEVLVLFEPRAAANTTGACSLEALFSLKSLTVEAAWFLCLSSCLLGAQPLVLCLSAATADAV